MRPDCAARVYEYTPLSQSNIPKQNINARCLLPAVEVMVTPVAGDG